MSTSDSPDDVRAAPADASPGTAPEAVRVVRDSPSRALETFWEERPTGRLAAQWGLVVVVWVGGLLLAFAAGLAAAYVWALAQ
jgi:hypothetical protein